MSAQHIIDGLKDAVAGNFARVTIDGQVWTRGERWQPIETAPKDKDILTFDSDGGIAIGSWYAGTWRDDGYPPTHWMPLPEPPPADPTTRSPDARAG